MTDYADNINTSDYIYHRTIYVTEITGERQTFIPLKLNLHQANFNFDTARSDGRDFRLAESDNGTGVLQMWTAYWNGTQRKATVWFKLPELLANDSKTLFAFWGSEYDIGDSHLKYMLGEAVDGETSTPVFLFGDDFDDGLDVVDNLCIGSTGDAYADSVLGDWPGYGAPKAFDSDYSSRWYSYQTPGIAYVGYGFYDRQVVDRIRFATAESNWTDVVFEASTTETGIYTVLQDIPDGMAYNTWYQYDFTNSAAYTHYRLRGTRGVGGGYSVSIRELEMYDSGDVKWEVNGSYTISDSKINLGTDTWIRTGNVLGGASAEYANTPYTVPASAGLYGQHQHSGNCYLSWKGGLTGNNYQLVDGNLTSYHTWSYISGGGCAIGVNLGEVKDKISFVRMYLYDTNENYNGDLTWASNTAITLSKSNTNAQYDYTTLYTYSDIEIPLKKSGTDYVWYFDMNLDAPGEEAQYFYIYGTDSPSQSINGRYSQVAVYADESIITVTPGKFIVEDGIEGIGSPTTTTVAAHRYRFYGGENNLGIDYFWEGSTDRKHDAVYAGTYSTYAGSNKGLAEGEYVQTYIGYYEPTDKVYQGMENRGGDQIPIYSEDLCEGGDSQDNYYGVADRAFDNDDESYWYGPADEDCWVRYEFYTDELVVRVVVNLGNIFGFEVQGTNNPSGSWDTLTTVSGLTGVVSTETVDFENEIDYKYMRLFMANSNTVNQPYIYEIEMMSILSYSSEYDYAESWERKVHRNTELSNFRIYGEDTSAANGVAIDWVIARDFEPETDPTINYSNLYAEYEVVYHQTVDYNEYQDDVTSVDFYHTSDMGGDPYRMSDNVTNSLTNIFVSDEGVTEGSIVIDFARGRYTATDNNYDHFNSSNTVEFYNAAKLSDLDDDAHDRDYWQTTTTSGWACIEFPTTENISCLAFIAIPGSSNRMPNNFKFYGSQSNPRYSGWNDKVLIYEGVGRDTETEQAFYFNTGSTYYKYYILEVLDTHGGNIGIQEWSMYVRTDYIGKKTISQLRLHPVAFEDNEYYFVKEVELYGSVNGYEWDILLGRTPTATPFVDYMYGRWGRYTFDNTAGYNLYKLTCYGNWRAATDQIKIAEWEMVERVEELDSYRILAGSTDEINNVWADPAANIDSGTLYITNDFFNTVENEKLIDYTTLSGSVDDFNVKL